MSYNTTMEQETLKIRITHAHPVDEYLGIQVGDVYDATVEDKGHYGYYVIHKEGIGVSHYYLTKSQAEVISE